MSCTSKLSMRVLGPQGVFIPLYTASAPQDFRPNDAQIQTLVQTLSYVPYEHLSRFSAASGHIRASGSQCTPLRGGGSDPAPWIRLSAVSFNDAINSAINITLLHEFGHVVDYLYGAMNGLRTRDQALYRLLAGTAHTGRTQGPSEAFADCYMIFVVTQIAGRGYTHPADPGAYQGRAATERFTALMNSPAFDNWSGVLSNLRTRAATGAP